MKPRWRSSLQSAKIRPGDDSGSDHELLIVKFKLKLKKVGKTTRPFSYHLNQIPYDYTGEVTNRFKKLDMVDRVPEEERDQNHPNEKEMQEGKVVVKQALQIARRDMKAFLNAKK